MSSYVRHLATFVVGSCMFAAWAHAGPVTLYVSPDGNDAWSGASAHRGVFRRSDGPFQTLVRARDEIRTLRQAGALPDGAVVELMPGLYELVTPFELTSQDSGTEAAPVVYRAHERGTAILSGGVVIRDWQPVSEPGIQNRLDDKAKGNVVWTELPADLFGTIPGFANGGCGYRGKPDYPVALFQNGERLQIARWPNSGYVKMGECLGATEARGHAGTTFTDGVFRFEDARLARWVGEPELWFDGLWFFSWADQKMRLKAIDIQAKTISLQEPKSHHFGFKRGQGFYAFNTISEIDQPGEWAVDRQARRLYLWPAADLRTAPVTVAARERLVAAEGIAYTTFDGLVFEGCREKALTFKNCTAITVAACTLRHLGSTAIDIDGGTNGTVIGCDMYDLGEGGAVARGGVYETLTPGKHLIENNHIHHFGRIVGTYRPGAAVYGVGNAIRHNLIYQAQHQAIYFNGNDHLVEYNILHDVCLHTNDAGAIYACHYDWSQRGTVIRHNLVHTLGEPVAGENATRGIYMDDQTTGTTIQGNILSSCEGAGIVVSCRDHVIANNLAVNCRVGFELSTRGINSFCAPDVKKGRDSIQFKKLLAKMDLFKSDLWRQRYPTLLAPMDQDPILAHSAHGCTLRNNVSAGSGPLQVADRDIIKDTCTIENNVDMDTDPGFEDAAALDLRLRSDAPIFEKAPGFAALEFAKMGLYDDPRRASPAVKFGFGVTPMPPIMSAEARQAAKCPVLFPVAAVPGPIRVDGILAPGEWAPVSAPGTPSGPVAELKWGADGKEVPFASRALFRTDGDGICIGVSSTLDPKKEATRGHQWGRDDAVELALAVARDAEIPASVTATVLRGYADGYFESVVDGGLSEDEALAASKGVEYAATRLGKGAWSAEWRIPFAALGTDPKVTNWPILAHLTVVNAAGKFRAGWRQRAARDSWEVAGAYALCLEPFGSVPFDPGSPVPCVRIDIQGDRKATSPVMVPGAGAEAPEWAQKWNRLVCAFGAARGDRWTPCRFEFTPQEDAVVNFELMGTQTPTGTPPVWTYYDDFRVEGAELVNGDFEAIGSDGKTPGWNCVLDQRFTVVAKGDAGVLALPAGAAASGSHVAKTSHDHRVVQSVSVKKGQKVTVSFQARAVLPAMGQ